MRLIYYGCAGFGQIFRSFSFNSPTIRLKRSKHLTQTSTPSLRSLISDTLLDTLREAKIELEQAGIRISGMSDHTVTQSLYLEDPDGNE